ncbi:HEPN family nuclease [Pseudomonas sp. SM4]|uniref:HEPN family nuclease n=1 Tax=Pseudomonas sp. SM4 TaxID=3424177 RepID=UPI003F79C0D8
MSYFGDFERVFMRRSLELVDTYNGEYETTQLLNGLIGLLFFPHEKMRELIPEIALQELVSWGFSPECIVNAGVGKELQDLNLSEVVRRMRNAVAHCRISPFPDDHRSCEGFCFKDANGFEAKMPTNQIKNLMRGLLEYLLRQ